MGYTGQSAQTLDASMEERTLRDVDRWKDKIEVRLDNRQVFLLFFGSALVACLLFILGVVVGKRIESRGKATVAEIEDPLALLDRVASAPAAKSANEGLTFPRTLMPSGSGRSKKEAGKDGEVARAVSASIVPAAEKAAQESAAAEKAAAERLMAEKAAAEKAAAERLATEKAAAEKAAEEKAALARAVAEKAAADKAAEEQAAAEKSALARASAEKAPSPVVSASAGEASTGGGFTLQIGSFQERGEAEEFAGRFASESAYIVESNIPGKGRWFRVRVGSYASNAEAMAAKAAFERKHRMIAYVAPR